MAQFFPDFDVILKKTKNKTKIFDLPQTDLSLSFNGLYETHGPPEAHGPPNSMGPGAIVPPGPLLGGPGLKYQDGISRIMYQDICWTFTISVGVTAFVSPLFSINTVCGLIGLLVYFRRRKTHHQASLCFDSVCYDLDYEA